MNMVCQNMHSSIMITLQFTYILVAGFVGLIILLAMKHSPPMYFAYIGFPFLFMLSTNFERHYLVHIISGLTRQKKWWVPAVRLVSYVIGLEILVS